VVRTHTHPRGARYPARPLPPRPRPRRETASRASHPGHSSTRQACFLQDAVHGRGRPCGRPASRRAAASELGLGAAAFVPRRNRSRGGSTSVGKAGGSLRALREAQRDRLGVLLAAPVSPQATLAWLSAKECATILATTRSHSYPPSAVAAACRGPVAVGLILLGLASSGTGGWPAARHRGWCWPHGRSAQDGQGLGATRLAEPRWGPSNPAGVPGLPRTGSER
jgi:hypothetical protein